MKLEGLLATRVQRWLHGITTEAEVHMATYSLFAYHCHKSTGHLPQAVQILIMTVVEVASGKGHADVRNAAYDFSVKLSSCICNHTDSSCPGCWLM